VVLVLSSPKNRRSPRAPGAACPAGLSAVPLSPALNGMRAVRRRASGSYIQGFP